jgi:hypothetical protein
MDRKEPSLFGMAFFFENHIVISARKREGSAPEK